MNITLVQQELLKAAELVQKQDFKSALQELCKIQVDDCAPAMIAEYLILVTKANTALGNYDETHIDKAIGLLCNSSENRLYAEAKSVKARIKAAISDWLSAKEFYLESYSTFRRCGDIQSAAEALNQLGYMSFITGDIDAAISNVTRSIEMFKSTGESQRWKKISLNLALMYCLGGYIRLAVEKHKEWEIYRRDVDVRSQIRYLLTYSIAEALNGDIKDSLRLINETNTLLSGYERERAQYYEYLGWIYILDNNFKEAEKALLAGLELSLKIAPESALISQTKRLLADAYIGLKKYDLAQKYAEEGLAVAERINERAEIAGCHRAFARLAANKGESAKTRDWFRKAIDLYAMISSRYELAVTRYLAATSGFYENGERAALLYMAKEYFESEDIKPYIEKVAKELATGAARKVTNRRCGDGQPVFIAEDPKTKKILELAENIAASDMTVLLTGPTGSGKDQLARYIHWYSGRKGPLIAVNCAAIPEGMVESELFGYSKGAFTSAQNEKKGLIEMADGGTFYFNEIADTPVQFQAKLLEFLETREIRHLGSTVPKKINVRIIAATNQNLNASMREGKFRADLYHRLNEIPIALASLRERPGDIAPLVRYFLTLEGVDFENNGDFDGFDDICGALLNRDWPGNVRQLHAEMRRYYLLARGDVSRISALIRGNKQTEREVLLQALAEAGGNQSEAARRLGISEMTVRRRIKDYNFGE